jgi:hypothetical protein
MFSGFSRFMLVFGIVGALVGGFFGLKGMLTAKHASDAVNRKGGDPKSQFHADRLTKSLDKVRAEVGADGHLLQLSIHPGYIQADASTGSEDKGRSFRVQEDGRVDELPVTLTGPGKVKDNVFPIDKLDTKVVEQLDNQAAAKEHLGMDDVSHIVVMIQPGSGKAGINVYLDNQRFWTAALDGKGLSNPDQQARVAIDDAEKAVSGLETSAPAAPKTSTPEATAPKADLASCLTAAGTDTAKITACTR